MGKFNLAAPFRQINLKKFGGLYTETEARDLPEGVSPRCHDNDFRVQSLTIRPGLQNVIQFGSAMSSKYAGLGSVSGGGSAWNSPANIEGAPNGTYATCTTDTPGSVTSGAQDTAQAETGAIWTNPQYLTDPSLYTSVTLPPNGISAPITAFFFPDLNVPAGAVITAIEVSVTEEANPGNYILTAILGAFSGGFSANGSPISLPFSSIPHLPPQTLTLGGAIGAWGATLGPSDFGTTSFAVQLYVTAGAAGGTVDMNNISVTVSYTLASGSQLLVASEYGFDIPVGTSISGVKIIVYGYQANGGFLQALLWNGSQLGFPKPFELPNSPGNVPLGSNTDGWGASITQAVANGSTFGVALIGSGDTFYIDAIQITLYLSEPTSPGVNWLKTFQCPGQGPLTLAIDTAGTLWQENVNSVPGVMTSIYVNLTPLGKALASNTATRCYLALSDLINPVDMPRQYDGNNLDRISQVGPGAGPQIVANDTDYPINPSPNGLTQPYAAVTANAYYWGNSPTDFTPTPGTTFTLEGAANQANFNTGVNIGDTIYIAGAPTLGGVNPDGVYVVTQVGSRAGAAGTYQFVTVNVSQSQNFGGATSATYRKTLALVSLQTPVANGLATVGGQLSISGAGVSDWDGTYKIVGTPAQGQLLITATALTGGVATYTYSLVSGASPGWQAGETVVLGQLLVSPSGAVWQVTTQGTTGSTIPAFATSPQADNGAVWTELVGAQMLVTVFGTSNGNGIFNVQNATITSATQSTFTIAIDQPDVTTSAEQGSAFSGSGNLFEIDPGLQYVGTDTDPFFTPSGGGEVVVVGAIAPGQRYAIEMFLTRNGYMTPASPPVPFFTSESAASLQFNSLTLGPPDVIARIVALTPANGMIGGPYYWIPEDVTINDLATGVPTTYNKTIIPDNISSASGLINFSDAVLLTGQNVTVQGNNVLQKRELGSCTGLLQFAGRMAYFGEQQKVDNFVNLTFDGGWLGIRPQVPAGWTFSAALLPLLSLPPSPIFGNCLYIQNNTGGVFNPSGSVPATLSQSAYQDAYNAPIIDPNLAYSVRINARIPSGSTGGSFVVSLFSPSQGTWSFLLPFTTQTDDFTQVIGQLNNPLWQAVPSDLQLQIYPQNMADGSDVQIDRIEIFPTLYPVYTTQMAVSYAADYESIDGVTGIVDTSSSNSQPIRCAYVLFDTLYIEKTASAVSTLDNDTTEPAGWEVKPVTNAVGAVGALAVDAITSEEEGTGEDYALVAARQGIYLFNGGNHIKISQELQAIWTTLYQPSLQTIWIKNDTINKRILVGVPLPTPNKWLPKAPTNANPAQPNVILAMSYLGMETPEELGTSPPAHISMFTGAMLARDLTRKWNPWQIPTQAVDWITRPDGSQQLWMGGISGTGKIYYLNPNMRNDDGAVIDQAYMTYGFSDPQIEEAMQLGSVRKLFGYATATLEGAGGCILRAYPETPETPYVDTFPAFQLSNPSLDDVNIPLNETGNRCFFEFEVDGNLNSYFELKRLVMGVSQDPKIPVTGR